MARRKKSVLDSLGGVMSTGRRRKRRKNNAFDMLGGALAPGKKGRRSHRRKGTGLALIAAALVKGPNKTKILNAAVGEEDATAARRRLRGRTMGQYLVDQMFGIDETDRQIERFERIRRGRHLGDFLADQLNPRKRIDQLDAQIEEIIEEEGLRLREGATFVERVMWAIRNLRAFKRFVR